MVTIPPSVLSEAPIPEDREPPKLPPPDFKIYDAEDKGLQTYFTAPPEPEEPEPEEFEDEDIDTDDVNPEDLTGDNAKNFSPFEPEVDARENSPPAADGNRKKAAPPGALPPVATESPAPVTVASSSSSSPESEKTEIYQNMYKEIMSKMAERQLNMSMATGGGGNPMSQMNTPMSQSSSPYNTMMNMMGGNNNNNPFSSNQNNNNQNSMGQMLAAMSQIQSNPYGSLQSMGSSDNNPMMNMMMSGMMKSFMQQMGSNQMGNPYGNNYGNPYSSGPSYAIPSMNPQGHPTINTFSMSSPARGMAPNPYGMSPGMNPMGPMGQSGYPGMMSPMGQSQQPNGYYPYAVRSMQSPSVYSTTTTTTTTPAPEPEEEEPDEEEMPAAPAGPVEPEPVDDVSLERKNKGQAMINSDGSESLQGPDPINDEDDEPLNRRRPSAKNGPDDEDDQDEADADSDESKDYESQMFAQKEQEVSQMAETTPVPSLEESGLYHDYLLSDAS